VAKKAITPLVYADASVYLDHIMKTQTVQRDSSEKRADTARRFFQAVHRNQVRLAASSLVEAEVSCNGEVRPGKPQVVALLQGWFRAPSTVWTDVDRTLTPKAVDILERYRDKGAGFPKKRMYTNDALHLAAAIRLGCDYFMAQDEGFPFGLTIDRMKIIRPEVVWAEDLWSGVEETG
jgi:predicted nucleic acid-binding protein